MLQGRMKLDTDQACRHEYRVCVCIRMLIERFRSFFCVMDDDVGQSPDCAEQHTRVPHSQHVCLSEGVTPDERRVVGNSRWG